MHTKRLSPVLGCLTLMCLASAAGCDRNQIRSYTVPKTSSSERPSAPESGNPTREAIDWQLPEGWEQRPGSGMRYATLLVESGDDPLELRVTPLGLVARDPLSNINRWRQQLGLGPIAAEQLGTVMRSIEAGGRAAQLIDIEGPAGDDGLTPRILAAILPGNDRVWFFVLQGSGERLGRHQAAFEEFVRSIRLTRQPAPLTASMPADHPPVADAGQAPLEPAEASITWQAPAGWEQRGQPNQFRVVGFKVGSAGETAEVAVTRFPGDVGGLLANVNRWRRQLGLEAAASLDEQRIDSIEVDGNPAARIDITADGAAGAGDHGTRMVVVVVERGDTTWFFKLTGPQAVVDSQQKAFDAFVRSVRFAGAGGGGGD